MPMSDLETAKLAIAAFLIVAVCGLALILLVAAVFAALDTRSARKALTPSRHVARARRPINH